MLSISTFVLLDVEVDAGTLHERFFCSTVAFQDPSQWVLHDDKPLPAFELEARVVGVGGEEGSAGG